MNQVMEYKGYSGSIQYNAGESLFVGRVIGITSVLMFEGASVDELKKDFADAVDAYLDTRETMGLAPEKPFTGRFTVNVTPDIHALLAMKAKETGKSLNEFVGDMLVHGVQ